jgi:hypothetical protein
VGSHPAPVLIEAVTCVMSAAWRLSPERQLGMDDLEWRMPAKAVPMAFCAGVGDCGVGIDAGGGVGGRGGLAGDSAVMTGCTGVGSGGDKYAGLGGGRSPGAESPSISAGAPGKTCGNGVRWA